MPDYQNGKIYKLVNDENDDIYYGSTTQILPKRLGDHKNKYKRHSNGKSGYVTSFNILKYPSCKIILVENFPCNSKYELEARERYYIEKYKCVNKVKPAMTNTLVDYKNGKIYKIINRETDDVYYGSTIQTIKNRFTDHKKNYKVYLNDKYDYVTSFEIVKYSSCKIVLVENFPCKSRYELEVRERYYIEKYKCVNKIVPTRTRKEWKNDNKDILKEKRKQNYQENKDEIKEQRRQYYQDNIEQISKHNKNHYQKNKEKCKKEANEYYAENTEKILEQKKQYYYYKKSWGGDIRRENNLLKIDIHLFL